VGARINGKMVPLRSLVEVRVALGPQGLIRYNNTRAVTVQGAPAPDVSSGQALAVMGEVAGKTLPAGYGGAWTDISFQEKRAEGQTTIILGFAVMVVVYSQLKDPTAALVGGAVMGMFVNGMLGGYGALMSELYPTEARATAQNVLFNLGRAVGGFGPLVIGALASAYSWQVAIALLAAIYVVDMLATALLIPERKGVALE